MLTSVHDKWVSTLADKQCTKFSCSFTMVDHQDARWQMSFKRAHSSEFVPSDELTHHSIQSEAVFDEFAFQNAMPSYYDAMQNSPDLLTSIFNDQVAKLCKARPKSEGMLVCDKAQLDPGTAIDIAAKKSRRSYTHLEKRT